MLKIYSIKKDWLLLSRYLVCAENSPAVKIQSECYLTFHPENQSRIPPCLHQAGLTGWGDTETRDFIFPDYSNNSALCSRRGSPPDVEDCSVELLRQQSYAIKNQLGLWNGKWPNGSFSLLIAGSLWPKNSWLPCTQRIYYRRPRHRIENPVL